MSGRYLPDEYYDRYYPNRKVRLGAAAGAAAALLLYAFELYTDTVVPAHVASEITVLVTAITSYIVREVKK